MLPGPTILSTFGIDSVPNAIAAIACAPPTLYTFVAPAFFAATNVLVVTFPSFQRCCHNDIFSLLQRVLNDVH